MNLSETNTPTQKWLRAHGACRKGQLRVGKLSVGQYWNICARADDILWFAKKLFPESDVDYNRAIASCKTYGRWAAVQTRRRVQVVMAEYGIQIPGELL